MVLTSAVPRTLASIVRGVFEFDEIHEPSRCPFTRKSSRLRVPVVA
jgi:hypothetical protein